MLQCAHTKAGHEFLAEVHYFLACTDIPALNFVFQQREQPESMSAVTPGHNNMISNNEVRCSGFTYCAYGMVQMIRNKSQNIVL